MRRKRDSRVEEVDIDMTPMIDVTFLLLIFFVTVSTFNQMETQAKVELPLADQAQVEHNPDPEQLTVNIEQDGGIFILGRKRTEEDIRRILAREAAKSMDEEGKFSNRSIVVRGHQELKYGKIQWLMKECQTHGIWKLHMVAKRAGE